MTDMYIIQIVLGYINTIIVIIGKLDKLCRFRKKTTISPIKYTLFTLCIYFNDKITKLGEQLYNLHSNN